MGPMRDWPVTNARRFEVYVRWSLYVFLFLVPIQYTTMLLGGTVGGATGWRLAQLILLVLLAGVVTWFNVRAAGWSFDRVMHGPARAPRRFVVAWLVAVALLAGLTVPIWVAEITLFLWYLVGCVIGAITPLLTARRTLVITLALGLVALPAAMLGWATAILGYFFGCLIIWTAWSMGWMLRVLRELQRASEVQAQLKVAEERLRISRDLHDVFGRTLATISVKSELAAELARRGLHERAADEMGQIRRIANTAGAEVRRVVRGERRASWADEVEGARALLGSASIRCVVAGEDVPAEYADTLAWVIREGVTNVLRHSRASQVSITTAVEPDEIAVTLTNDGAHETGVATESTGTGLATMADRLRGVGGTLEHQQDGDWFLLTASIPTPQEVPA